MTRVDDLLAVRELLGPPEPKAELKPKRVPPPPVHHPESDAKVTRDVRAALRHLRQAARLMEGLPDSYPERWAASLTEADKDALLRARLDNGAMHTALHRLDRRRDDTGGY